MKIKHIESVYSVLITATLVLHVFNTLGGETFKAFHIPAFLSCICSYYLANKKDKLYKYIIRFLLVTLISASLSYSSGSLMSGITMCIVMMSCIGLSYIDKTKVLKLLLPIIPAVTTFLLLYAFKENAYRYQGFYNDPNYLCTTLMAFLYVSILTYKSRDSKIVKYIQVYNIVIIEVIVILTLSRTGLLCSMLLVLVAFFDILRQHFLKVLIGLIIVCSVSYKYVEPFLDARYALLYERLFENNDNLEGAGRHRGELSTMGLKYIVDHPVHILVGIGIGSSSNSTNEIPDFARYGASGTRDHNTWTSCITEQGIIAFAIWIMMFVAMFKKIKYSDHSKMRMITMMTFAVLLLFSLSIWQMTYLPFWWLLFFINHRNQIQVNRGIIMRK